MPTSHVKWNIFTYAMRLYWQAICRSAAPRPKSFGPPRAGTSPSLDQLQNLEVFSITPVNLVVNCVDDTFKKHGHWCMYRPMRWQQNIWGEAFAWTSKDRRRSFYIIYANPKKFFSNAGPFLALLHIAPFLFISRGRFISSAWRFQHVFIAHHRHQIW